MTIVAPVDNELLDPAWAQQVTDAINGLVSSLAIGLANLSPVLFQATQAVTQSIANITTVPISFTTEDIDTAGGHDGVTNNTRYVCQAGCAGYYLCAGGIAWPANATGSRAASWSVNGSLVPGSQISHTPVAAQRQYPARTLLIHLNVGDYLEMNGFQDSGGPLSTDVSFTQFNSTMTAVLAKRD